MKNILYALIISIVLSCNVSYPMQQSIIKEKIIILTCLTAGCGILLLYIINHHKHSLPHWLKSLYPTNPTGFLIIPMPPEVLDKKTAEYLKKSANQIKGTTELHTACENDDVQEVKSLLTLSTTNINAQRDHRTHSSVNGSAKKRGETPLHIACKNKNIEIVKILLAHKDIDITIQDKNGDTPLHLTCRAGDQYIVQILLVCNASNINQENDRKESALCLSYVHNHTNIFNFLLNQENIDLKNLLTLACDQGDMDTVQLLFKHKNIQLNDNMPLYKACKHGYFEIVLLLLKHNENNCMKINELAQEKDDTSCDTYNPLLIACQQIKNAHADRVKFVAIIEALLNDPAINIDTKTENKFTPFHFAATDDKLLELLLKKNSQLISEQTKSSNAYRGNTKTTALHIAIKAANRNSIFLLLEYGANISKKNQSKDTPFTLACIEAHEEANTWSIFKKTTYQNIVKELLQSSHVIQEIINSSECLYKLDLEKTDTSIPQLLLSCGANPNQINKKDSSSALLKAAECNAFLLNLFIDNYNGDVTQKDSNNRTVFYKAFMSNIIQNPNQINCFKKLDQKGKNEFMQRELLIVASATPRNIFIKYPHVYDEQSIKEINNYIKLFNSFITTCINYGEIDLTTKTANNKTFIDDRLNTAYEKLDERDKKFHQSNRRKLRCMNLNENICHYTTNNYNDTRCEYCERFILYNELIVHGFLYHSNATTLEQAVDKTIALTYQETPLTYYLYKQESKQNYKNCIEKEVKKNNVSSM